MRHPRKTRRTLSAFRNLIGVLVGLTALAQFAMADRYVVKDNPGAKAPYDSWATAAGDIQTAIDAAAEGPSVFVRSSQGGDFLTERSYRSTGETVWVRAGTYDVGGRPSGRWRHALNNRVAIDKAIAVRSETNDPKTAIIRGGWSSKDHANGPNAVRCAYLADGAALIGFTLTGGATMTMDEQRASDSDRSGGGVYAQSGSATIVNCVIADNSANGDPRQGTGGGGTYGGTFRDCRFINNRSEYHGGGADRASFFHCVVSGNSARGDGGGLRGGAASACVIADNVATASGGGVFGADLTDCRVENNRAGAHGGGAASTDGSPPVTLSDCVIVRNRAERAGGGARMARLLNCRVSDNVAAVGPDTYQCSILDKNVGPSGPENGK